jgi:hypothetical protein
MAKQGGRLPHHVRTSIHLKEQMERWLDEEHEKIVDISFRFHTSPLGPVGWNVIIERTVLGESSTHGVNFGGTASPSKKEICEAAKIAVEQLREREVRNSLIVKPGDAPYGMKKGVQ